MAIKARSEIKTYFQDGDVPTESQFSDFIDSTATLSGDNISVGNWSITGDFVNDGTISVNGQAWVVESTTLVPTGSAQVIDWDTGNSQVIDLGSASTNVTLTLQNPQQGASYFVKIIQGPTARTITLPSTVLMPGGSAPTTLIVSTTNNAIDTLVLYYDGINYLGVHAKEYG